MSVGGGVFQVRVNPSQIYGALGLFAAVGAVANGVWSTRDWPVLIERARLKISWLLQGRACWSCGLAVLVLLFGSRSLQNAVAEGETRTISMRHIHTGEDITITYKRNGVYDPAAMKKLDWLLRDWRRGEATRMDPHLIDLLWEVRRETGSKAPIWVVCGYRSPRTNAMLRRRSHGVARFSQHMLGRAMDFYIPGVPLSELRVIGLRLQRGGVGFYPTSGSPFVHMDTGGVRMWPRMTHAQLVRVFPDGRTVLIPSDGRPLRGYAQALADIRRRRGTTSPMSLAAARNAGIDVAAAGGAHRNNNLFAGLLGLGNNEDEREDDSAAAAATAKVPAPARSRVAAARPPHGAAKTAVAALDRDQEELAAEKAKLIAIATHMTARALPAASAGGAAAPIRVAALTPNEIIRARGYWQGLPDSTRTARPSVVPASLTAARLQRGADRALDADYTGSIRAAFAHQRADSRADGAPPELTLAYAEPIDWAPRHYAVAAGAAGSVATRATVISGVAAAPTGRNDLTIALKRAAGQPAALLTVADRTLAAPVGGKAIDNPWLRAIVLSPSVPRFLTITQLGAQDYRLLAPLIIEPRTSVMMTFSAAPRPDLPDDRFTGGAIVFVPTLTYPMHNASLQ